MSLNFTLKNRGIKKSDMALIFLLIKDTEIGDIKWIKEYDHGTILRYYAVIDIENTKKKIKITYFINRTQDEWCYLDFHIQINPNAFIKVREIKGPDVMPLLNYIKK